MALAETASLIVDLNLRGNFGRGLTKVSRDLNTFDSRLDRSQTRAYRFGQQIGTGIRRGAALAAGGLAFLALNVSKGLDSLIDLEQQVAQTNAVLRSTKGIANVDAAAVGKLAEKYESLNALIGDEVIRSAENLLLTFTNVRSRAFQPALTAILDMNTALGRGEGGLQQSVIQVGKALQDPIRGITALRRAGVNFTKAQEKKIKSLIKEGKAYEAQKLILAELNREFGGSFAKQGATTAGRIAKFRDSIDDLQRALAKALLPTLGNVADALTKLLADPKVIASVEALGKDLAGLFSQANLAKGARLLGDFFSAAKEAAPGIIAGAKVAGQVVATAVRLFQSLPPEIQKIAIGALAVNKLTGGIVTNLAGGLISAVLKQLVAGVVNVQGAVVNVGGGIPGGGIPGGKPGAPTPTTGALAPAIGAGVVISEADLNQALDIFHRKLSASVNGPIKELQSRLHAVMPPRANEPRNLPPGHDLKLTQDQLAAIKERTGQTTAAITALDPKFSQIYGGLDQLGPDLDMVSGTVSGAVDRGAIATQSAIRTAEDGAASRVVGATHGAASSIVAAIYAARPIVNVTSVTKTTTITNRYGPPNGSYGQTSGH